MQGEVVWFKKFEVWNENQNDSFLLFLVLAFGLKK